VKTNGNRVWWQAHDGPVRDIVLIDGDKIGNCSDRTTAKLWNRVGSTLLFVL